MSLPTPANLKHYLDIYEQCPICKFPIFTDKKHVKKHPFCQREYNGAVRRQYNYLYKELRKEGLTPQDATDEQRQQVHYEAMISARQIVQVDHATEIAAYVESTRREQSQKLWERFKQFERDPDDEFEPPLESRATEFEAGAVEYGMESWEDQWQ